MDIKVNLGNTPEGSPVIATVVTISEHAVSGDLHECKTRKGASVFRSLAQLRDGRIDTTKGGQQLPADAMLAVDDD